MQSVNLSKVLLRFDGDIEFYIEILAIYLNETRNNICSIKDCLNNGRNDDLRRLIHSVKGGSNNVCAMEVAKVAKEIEDRIINQDYSIMDHVLYLDRVFLEFREYAIYLIENGESIKTESRYE